MSAKAKKEEALRLYQVQHNVSAQEALEHWKKMRKQWVIYWSNVTPYTLTEMMLYTQLHP